jgi:hypothetical protein
MGGSEVVEVFGGGGERYESLVLSVLPVDAAVVGGFSRGGREAAQ